jgi:predicted NBD/HSP70 family sugar kinase
VYNDSQAAAMGEFTYGSDYQAENNLVVINVGHGIGSGIILNGQLFQGDSGGAGEIGHIVVVPEGGRPCRCGHFGCLETVASGQALIQQVESTLVTETGLPSWVAPQPLDMDAVEKLNSDGDPLVHDLVESAGRYLGLAAANLVGTLNIHRIVLVGEMTRFGQPWLEAVRSSMQQSALATLAQDTQVEIGKLERNTIILGVCALLSNNYALLLGT